MLHSKFEDHWKFGSEVEKILSFTINGQSGDLGHMTWTNYIMVCYTLPKKAPHKICFDWLGVSEKLSYSFTCI